MGYMAGWLDELVGWLMDGWIVRCMNEWRDG